MAFFIKILIVFEIRKQLLVLLSICRIFYEMKKPALKIQEKIKTIEKQNSIRFFINYS